MTMLFTVCVSVSLISYPTALAMISSGKVNVKPLVTHRFDLEQAIDAFEAARKGDGVKIIINCARREGKCS